MKLCACGLILAAVLAIAGCGGGGGGQGASTATLSSDVVGTYRVEGLGLPNDELGVQSDGDVVVNADSLGERGGAITRIGACSPQGALTLNGTWRTGGVDFSITASGELRPETHSLMLQATVAGSNGLSHHDEPFTGDWVSDLEVPPPPPGGGDDAGGGDDIELPPPPPGGDDGGGDDIEIPPPPPG
jgi:hypothetical protein